MIKACDKCGGLYATANEMFGGRPCLCVAASDTERWQLRDYLIRLIESHPVSELNDLLSSTGYELRRIKWNMPE